MADGGHNDTPHNLDDEFGLSAVRELLQLISETDVTEIQIERGSAKLHIKRGAVVPNPPSFMVTPSLMASMANAPNGPLPPVAPFQQGQAPPVSVPIASAPVESEIVPAGQVISSPMVGTFYTAPSPKDPPYVQEGDTIQPDEVVGIVEAMKIMNEITFEGDSPARIVRILVSNGQPVEYGQPLMVVETL